MKSLPLDEPPQRQREKRNDYDSGVISCVEGYSIRQREWGYLEDECLNGICNYPHCPLKKRK